MGLTPSSPPSMVSLTVKRPYFFDDLQFNGQKKKKSFQLPGKKETWMGERDLQGQPELVLDPMNIPTKFLPWKKKIASRTIQFLRLPKKLSLASGLGNLTSDSSVSGQVVKLVSKTW